MGPCPQCRDVARRPGCQMTTHKLRPAFQPPLEGSCEALGQLNDARGAELEAMNYDVRAKRVRECGAVSRRVCKLPYCPSCGARKAARNADLAIVAAARFERPIFATLTRPTEGPFRLAAGLDHYRDALLRWRRSNPVARVVRGGVGGLEPHLDRARSLWAVHAHLLLDVTASVDLDDLAERWGIATGDRGLFLISAKGADVESLTDSARYATKARDWCPPPGALPLTALNALFRAMRGRRVLIAWGTGRPNTKKTGAK